MLLPLLMLAEPPRRLRNRRRPAALLDEVIRDFFDDVIPAKVTRAEAYVDLPPAEPNGFKVEINIVGFRPDELKVKILYLLLDLHRVSPRAKVSATCKECRIGESYP